MRGLPPAPAAEGGLLPQLLAAGRPPGRGDREEGTGPRPRRLRRGQVAPAVVRRRGQDDPPPPAAPPGRGPRPRRAARSPLGAAGLPAPGQSLRFHARHWTAASVSNPALEQARAIASRLGEARGWNPRIQAETRRALAVMLASHVPGEKIPWSALEPALRPRDLSVSRTAEILSSPGCSTTTASFPWTVDREQARHAGARHRRLRPQLAGALRHGTSRSLPRSPDTARIYLRSVHPLLEQWSGRYDHLREVTAGDAAAAIAALRGHQRRRPSPRCGP